MSIGNQVKSAAIITFVKVWGHGALFTRVLDEINRANTTMPHVTGKDKQRIVFADLKIIFNDLLKPITTSVLNLLIELGVAYVKLQNPLVGEIISEMAIVAQDKINGS